MLLAHWTQFARAAVSLPRDIEGDRWRATVAPAIALQAITFAVGDLESLPPSHRPLALDMAGVLARRHAGELNQAWRAVEMPPKITELIHDTLAAIADAGARGCEWSVASPRFVMPSLESWAQSLHSAGFEGELLAALPGTILFAGEPAIFLRPSPPDSAPLPPLAPSLTRAIRSPRQVYRQLDIAGARVVRDLIAPLDGDLPPGRPLLAHVIQSGRLIPQHDDRAAADWRAAQEQLLGDAVPLIEHSQQ
jgi:hypothetical protein